MKEDLLDKYKDCTVTPIISPSSESCPLHIWMKNNKKELDDSYITVGEKSACIIGIDYIGIYSLDNVADSILVMKGYDIKNEIIKYYRLYKINYLLS